MIRCTVSHCRPQWYLQQQVNAVCAHYESGNVMIVAFRQLVIRTVFRAVSITLSYTLHNVCMHACVLVVVHVHCNVFSVHLHVSYVHVHVYYAPDK